MIRDQAANPLFATWDDAISWVANQMSDDQVEKMSVTNRPKIRRFQLRQLVREEVLNYLAEGGSRDLRAAEPELRDRIQDKYGMSPFVEILLKLLVEMLPLLLALFDDGLGD